MKRKNMYETFFYWSKLAVAFSRYPDFNKKKSREDLYYKKLHSYR